MPLHTFRPDISGSRGALAPSTGGLVWLCACRNAHHRERRTHCPARRGHEARGVMSPEKPPEERSQTEKGGYHDSHLGERFGTVRIFTASELMSKVLPPVR